MEPTEHGTLTANVPRTVTLPGIIRGFRVTHRGTDGDADIWWTFNYNSAVPATVAGAGTYNLPPAQQDEENDPAYRAQRFSAAAGAGITAAVFSLISEGSVPFSVETW